MTTPVIVMHHGIAVVRDDLFPGGTKARYIGEVFDEYQTVVYPSPCEGGAQVALAGAAKARGGMAVIVCAKRRVRHQRTLQALDLGASLVEVDGMAMYQVVVARARTLASERGWYLAPFGLETKSAVASIAAAARSTGLAPSEVWSVASSGVLARGLAAAWPEAERHVVQTGHKVTASAVAGAAVHVFERPFSSVCSNEDFPSDPHYDAKAWLTCKRAPHGPGLVVFWNVTGGCL